MARATLLLCSLLFGAGCQSLFHAADRNSEHLTAWWNSQTVKPDEISDQTWELLRYWDLDTAYSEDCDAVLIQAAQMFQERPEREWAGALAELSFLAGARAHRAEVEDVAADHFYHSVAYAYYFLFTESEEPNIFDRRNAAACSFYNRGLEKCLAIALKQRGLDPARGMRLNSNGQALAAPIVLKGFAWQPHEFHEVLLARDYQPSDHIHHQTVFGLGVPLIGVRHRQNNGDPSERFLVDRHPFAVTAFFHPDLRRITRFPPRIESAPRFAPEPVRLSATGDAASIAENQLDVGGATGFCGRLDLYDPLRISEIEVAAHQVPIEVDFAAPMAFVLEKGRHTIQWGGFFEPDEVQKYAGLYMFEPYQPGKIPVVFVHGLLSGPITWTEMVRELWARPEIRENYQCWFFLYPTGSPFLASANLFRQHLREAVGTFGQQDPAVNRMVLVGHSMGGLLSQLQVTESGDQLWSAFSRAPLGEIKTDPATRETLQQTFFFEPQPAVKRVVFIGTPHHGSKLSQAPIGRVGSYLVRLPKSLLATQQQLVRDNPQAFDAKLAARPPTSVDMLASDNPILQAMAQLPFPSQPHLHSIIGTKNDNAIGRSALADYLAGHQKEAGDGVVSLTSAEIEPVDTELFVPAKHEMVHRHPLTFAEVRRILLEHLEQIDSPNSIRPVHGLRERKNAALPFEMPLETGARTSVNDRRAF